MVIKVLKDGIKLKIIVLGFLLSGAGFAKDVGESGLVNRSEVIPNVVKSDASNKSLYGENEDCIEDNEDKTKAGENLPKKNINSVPVKDGVKETFFVDNEQIRVALSNRDINRVLVKGDKIQTVNGPAGLYIAKNDASGSAYINLFGDKAFTIFFSTVKGHNFSLLITPKTVAGRTVILEPTTPSLSSSRFEEAESYQKSLVTLISGMINNEDFGDYAYGKAKRSHGADFHGIANIRQVASYSGSRFLGLVSEIKNKTRKPITLKPSYFYHEGVRAVALSQQTLAPMASGFLYQVVGIE
ncbi:MAG: type-F conjugative transfer system secretin TraK [Gammaproteobacteria bacterium]|nr:type-F conjugative transfer system secretin TraK [Gammaproteobacteria bacterium]